MSTELVERLRDAEQRIAALMSERSSLIATKAEQLVALTKRATAAEAKVTLLTEALKPFAKAADIKLCGEWRDDEQFGQTDVGFYLTFGHLRAARRALSEPDKEEVL